MQQEPKQPDYEALGRAIEEEVRATVTTLASTIQDVAQNVGNTVRQTAGQSGRQFSKIMQDEIGRATAPDSMYVQWKEQAQKNLKKMRKINYAKKAKSALSESGGLAFVGAIISAVSVTAMMDGEPFSEMFVLWVIAMFFFGGALFSLRKGRRLQRIALYMNQLGTRSYCTTEELAGASQKSKRYVQKDLQRFITDCTLENVYLAPDGSRLFATQTAYRLYLAHQAQENVPVSQPAPQPLVQEDAPPAQETVLDECRSFLRQMRAQNALIADAAVTAQITQIENHMALIIQWLEKHPTQQERVRRFTSYYLPTILKLLQTYLDVNPHADNASLVATNIQQDIVGILYSINSAFTTLGNSLMEDTALSVSAEISAMETMLAQDGLAKSDF